MLKQLEGSQGVAQAVPFAVLMWFVLILFRRKLTLWKPLA